MDFGGLAGGDGVGGFLLFFFYFCVESLGLVWGFLFGLCFLVWEGFGFWGVGYFVCLSCFL